MTVRDLIQKLILATPDLDAIVYINSPIDECEVKDWKIVNITNHGCNDSLHIEINEWS